MNNGESTAQQTATTTAQKKGDFVHERSLLAGFLLISCTTAHVVLSSDSVASSQVELGAAAPQVAIQVQPNESTPVVRHKVRTPESAWRTMHLSNRHYATLASRDKASQLQYLCMEGVSCGWFVNLQDESTCNKTNKGEESRVRVETRKVVRDFLSRCTAYGLIHVGVKPGAADTIRKMVLKTDLLKFVSVGTAGLFRTQVFDSRGADEALNKAIVSAKL